MSQISEECSAHISDDALIEEYRSHLAPIKNMIAIRSGEEQHDVPVFFTVLRNDDGTETFNGIDAAPVSQELIDQALENVNEIFQPIGFNFVQVGDLHFIDNTEVRKLIAPYRQFTYVSSALNIVIGGLINNGVNGSANMPNGLPADRNFSNTLWLRSSNELLNATFPHELGHSFGLFHTFEGARLYDNPKDPLTNVPNSVHRHSDNPDRNSTNFFKRELVIRDNAVAGEKNFPFYNADVAGDFVEDTPASCATSAKMDFPDWNDPMCKSYSTMGSCYSGCLYDPDECIYIGNYVDYNGDTIQNATVMVRNFMSYTGKCRQEFTPGQYKRMSFYHHIYRRRQYSMDRVNIQDFVQLENSDAGLENVKIKFRHPGSERRHCNATTNSEGKFQGILYDDAVIVENIAKIGRTGMEDYAKEEWLEGVDIRDVLSIVYHIYHYRRLNGYRQIAADINRDGQITIDDALALRDMIIGEKELFPNYDTPWLFIPEQIVNEYQRAFHKDPFNMAIDGQTFENEVPFVRPEWLQVIADGLDGRSGFDAVKMGDVDGSMIAARLETFEFRESFSDFTPEIRAAIADLGLEELLGLSDTDYEEYIPLIDHQFNCFPNPTAGTFDVVFAAGQAYEGLIRINDRFGKTIKVIDQSLNKGVNKITINEPDLPAGLLVVTLTGQEGSFSQEIIKVKM